MDPARAAGVGIHVRHMIVSAIMLHRRLHIVPVAHIFGLVVAAFRVTNRHVIHAGIGTAVMLGTSRRDGALSIPGAQCRIALVGLVPALRVARERRAHLRKRLAQEVLSLPADRNSVVWGKSLTDLVDHAACTILTKKHNKQ